MCVLFIFEVKSLEVADEKKKERKVMSPGRFLASLLSDDEKSIKDPDDDKHNRGGNAPDPKSDDISGDDANDGPTNRPPTFPCLPGMTYRYTEKPLFTRMDAAT